jgi:hypothetical protein
MQAFRIIVCDREGRTLLSAAFDFDLVFGSWIVELMAKNNSKSKAADKSVRPTQTKQVTFVTLFSSPPV